MQTAAVRTSRRHFLIGSAGLAVAITMPLGMAAASTGEVDDLVNKVAGGKSVQEGKITLELPTIAENGLVVPLNFSVDSPMTADDYVKSVHLFADANPNPQLATYSFTPLSPKAAAQLRIRLARE